jgi:hypothetical protein
MNAPSKTLDSFWRRNETRGTRAREVLRIGHVLS